MIVLWGCIDVPGLSMALGSLPGLTAWAQRSCRLLGCGWWLRLGPQALSWLFPRRHPGGGGLVERHTCPWLSWESRGLQSGLEMQAPKQATSLPAGREDGRWRSGELVGAVSRALARKARRALWEGRAQAAPLPLTAASRALPVAPLRLWEDPRSSGPPTQNPVPWR